MVIGFQELQFLALGSGLADVFDLKKAPAGFDASGLWLHSMAVAWTARELAEAIFHLDAGGIMLAGLLHDLGKLVLATHLKDDLVEVLRIERRGLPYFQAEIKAGVPHPLVGYLLARAWGLPDLQTAVIRYHHRRDQDSPYVAAINIVALADDLVKSMDVGLAQDAPPLDRDAALKEARLSQVQFNSVIKAAEEQIPSRSDTWLQMVGGA